MRNEDAQRDGPYEKMVVDGDLSHINECPMCFNLCLPIPFNTSVLNSSRSDFASIDGKLAPISNLSARSERIRELTFARTHGSAYSAMVANMTSTYGSISARVARNPFTGSRTFQ